MRPGPGEVLHFSEDPTITVFDPHIARTARQHEAYVWAVDAEQAPAYWFPRDCPRALAWVTPDSTPGAVDRIIGPGGGTRVHAVEYPWLDRIRSVQLFAYRFPARAFQPLDSPAPHAYVATQRLYPLGPPELVGDLFALHGAAGIQLRVLPALSVFWAAVTSSSLGFSGIRLRNAAPS